VITFVEFLHAWCGIGGVLGCSEQLTARPAPIFARRQLGVLSLRWRAGPFQREFEATLITQIKTFRRCIEQGEALVVLSGSLSGSVADPSGQVIPNAAVTLISEVSSEQRSATGMTATA